MIIRIRSEAYFLNNGLLSVIFYLFQLFLLFVDELVIVNYLTNRRNRIRRYFNKVQFLLLRYRKGIFQRIYTLLHVFTNKANLLSSDKLINVMFGFLFLKGRPWSSIKIGFV